MKTSHPVVRFVAAAILAPALAMTALSAPAQAQSTRVAQVLHYRAVFSEFLRVCVNTGADTDVIRAMANDAGWPISTRSPLAGSPLMPDGAANRIWAYSIEQLGGSVMRRYPVRVAIYDDARAYHCAMQSDRIGYGGFFQGARASGYTEEFDEDFGASYLPQDVTSKRLCKPKPYPRAVDDCIYVGEVRRNYGTFAQAARRRD